MTDLMATRASFLASECKAHMASAVTYSRGADSVSVSASRGRSQFNVEVGGEVYQTTDAQDFIITAADLVLDGVAVEPIVGDRIVDPAAVDGETTYEVLAPGEEPVWRWTDSSHRRRRIHTKRISTEET